LILSVPSEGYCRNAYMMWGFWCDCSLFFISKELLAIAVYILFSIITIHIKSVNKKKILNIHIHAL
jgi:hypothetical protein